MPDYSKAKIYRVFCGEDEYIGSTIRPLSERMNQHRSSFKTGKRATASYEIFERHGIENVKIELIEDYPCENIEHLHKREGEIQRERDCVNRCIAGRTPSQWHQDNREHQLECMKKYHQDNRDHRSEYMKKYNQDNREHRLENMKKYYQDNREHLKEYKKKYYQDNREHLKEYKKEYMKKWRQAKKDALTQNPPEVVS